LISVDLGRNVKFAGSTISVHKTNYSKGGRSFQALSYTPPIDKSHPA